ncbi:MAG: hypothetical protein PWP23_253 [Candidatus Sumerlaeota bacterium]|nr:hypothetical protein [Candidatus Sumerlaeota bacterium]
MGSRERGHCLLVVSEDDALHRRIEEDLALVPCDVHRRTREEVSDPAFWRRQECYPGAVLLDLDEDLDAGVTVLLALKRARVPSPVIVLTPMFSREFGTKIVSQGIGYCLSRDFDSHELCEVVASLVWPRQEKAAARQTPRPRGRTE